MNVSDKWMLEQMQQMAASMAASLPQTGQNAEAPKTDKGESFQDLMNKAKDQQVEPSKKDDAPAKRDTVQSKEPAQNTQQAQTAKVPVKTDGKQVDLTAEQAALLATGYAQLYQPTEDAPVMLVTVQDENGELILPLVEQEDSGLDLGEIPVITENDWVMELTPELTAAVEQLLQKTDDPRTVDDIIGQLQQKVDSAKVTEPKLEVVVKTSVTEETGEQTDDQDDTSLDAQIMTARQPLFHDVKAAPVKVGENVELDTQQPDMDQQLADAIQFAAQQNLRQIEIKLSPENLGNLTIKLTQASDGTLQVVLHATNAKAANLLTQHISGLNMALQGYNASEVRIEVQRNEDSQQPGQQQHQTDPDGHNRQQQEQQRRQEEADHSGDFIQKLRLGLFDLDDSI